MNVGDEKIPSPPRLYGATALFAYFLLALGFAALGRAAYLWAFSCEGDLQGWRSFLLDLIRIIVWPVTVVIVVVLLRYPLLIVLSRLAPSQKAAREQDGTTQQV